MAQRRMFNKSITNSSKFLKMPMSSRLLYYDLGMNADDDGYVEHFMVLRMTGATQQDLGVLEVNGLVKVFDENVLWIRDWKENNYIQKDRYTPSKYLGIYNLDTICIQDVYTGKDSIGKISIDNKKEINKEKNIKKEKYGTYGRVKLTIDEYLRLADEFGEDFIKKQIELLDEYIESNNNKNKYTNFNLVLRKSIRENWFNKKQEDIPEWFDKKNKKEEITEEEQNEIEELLKEI